MNYFKTPELSTCQLASPSLSSISTHQAKGSPSVVPIKAKKSNTGVIVLPNLSTCQATDGTSPISSFSSSMGDPFLNDIDFSVSKKSRKLSPTANPFQPRQLVAISESSVLETIQSISQDSILDTPSASSATSDKTGKESEESGTLPMAEGIFDYVYPLGEFASDRYTRYLKISGVPGNLKLGAITVLIKGKTYRTPDSILDLEHLRRDGIILLEFASIVDAVNAAGEIPNNMVSWKSDFVNAHQFSKIMTAGKGPLMSMYKGQLAIIATHKGPLSGFSQMEITDYVVGTMKDHGSILAWDIVKTDIPHVYVHMEYYDINDSNKAKEVLDGAVFGALELSVKDYTPNFDTEDALNNSASDVTTSIEEELSTMFGSFEFTKPLTNTDSNTEASTPHVDKVASDFAATKPRSFTTPVHRRLTSHVNAASFPYSAPLPANMGFGYNFESPIYGFSPTTILPTVGSTMSISRTGFPSTRATRANTIQGHSGNTFGGGNNVVNVHRIIHGQDVRTTIMLRNIPNKMPQTELKQLIDETNFGEYDFMYLRIDFANNCNVGYAFINFVDPLAIARFVTARAGMKWPNYNSDKVAEISYATIQGKDCLIQKFRNSSVMLEDPSFRPKLFHTGNGPMTGKEEIFPGPDNDSKLRRSIENAGAVGLFAPRAGQFFRETQRRRRSQFDRGTHFAQIEEENYGPEHGYIGFNPNALTGPSLYPHSAPPHRSSF